MSLRTRVCRAILVIVALFSLASCGTPGTPTAVAPVAKPSTYVAIGGSDAVGGGSSDPLLDAWPQLFFRKALPISATFINLAAPNSTVADALADQLPTALASAPNLVTIWLTTADLLAGVPAPTYGAQLAKLVADLRARGATVLLGNAPPGNQLPGYRTCVAGTSSGGDGPACPTRLPDMTTLEGDVNAYNRVIASDASASGAVLVDLHSAVSASEHGAGPSFLDAAGSDLSPSGDALVASAFASALTAQGQGSR